MTTSILVVDDEQGVRDSIRMILEYDGYAVRTAESGARGVEAFRMQTPGAVLLDIKMPPGKDGMEVLGELQQMDAEVPVIMISGHGTFETAVEAVKSGAFDYLAKPLDREKLLITVRNAIAQRKLRSEIRSLRPSQEILGDSAAIRNIFAVVRQVAPTDTRVLITGESGTGKELVAREIHRLSKRSAGPFVEVNCAAIPAELIESELFGHEKGSFTGATAQRTGKFEQAAGGTLFLDEVGDMSLQAQAKVLRALEENTIARVGGAGTIRVDARVLAATNKNLPEEISRGAFREDLFHRLNVIPMTVPPLRERREDIPVMVKAFIADICSRNGFRPKTIDDQAMRQLEGNAWRGNVRELRNYVERLVILTPGDRIGRVASMDAPPQGSDPVAGMIRSVRSLKDFQDASEGAYIAYWLEQNGWNVSKTAAALGMERSHLYTKIRKYGLERGE